MWLENESGEHRVYFESKVVETDTVVISGAYVTLSGLKKGEVANSSAPVADLGELAGEKILADLDLRLKSTPAIAKSVNAVYEFHLSKGDRTKEFGKNLTCLWTPTNVEFIVGCILVADLKKGEIYAKAGRENTPKPQCTILIKDEDFVSLASGSANPQSVCFFLAH